MLKIYGIKTCDSVKKAISFFKKNNIDYEFIDFKSSPVGCEEISKWLTQNSIKDLFNTRSTTYRNLKLKELNLDENGKKEYLCKENLLIKRPIVEYNSEIMVGFNEENYKRSLL